MPIVAKRGVWLLTLHVTFPYREPEIQALWKEKGTYRKLLEKADAAGAERFTLHDGPPYANGSLHMGHALNKVPPPSVGFAVVLLHGPYINEACGPSLVIERILWPFFLPNCTFHT